jgi:hypothetical protein
VTEFLTNHVSVDTTIDRDVAKTRLQSELDLIKETTQDSLPYGSLSEALTRLLYFIKLDRRIDRDCALHMLRPLVEKHHALLREEAPRCATCYKTTDAYHPGVFGTKSDCRQCSRLFRESKQRFWSSYVCASHPCSRAHETHESADDGGAV